MRGARRESRAGSRAALGVRGLLRSSAPWLTVLAVLGATPGATEVVHELLSLETDIACCGEPCDEDAGHCNPTNCAHCRCNAHPSAISLSPVLTPTGPIPSEQAFAPCADRACASGYRAPPFRPPTA